MLSRYILCQNWSTGGLRYRRPFLPYRKQEFVLLLLIGAGGSAKIILSDLQTKMNLQVFFLWCTKAYCVLVTCLYPQHGLETMIARKNEV